MTVTENERPIDRDHPDELVAAPVRGGDDRISAIEERLERTKIRHDTWTVFVYAIAALALIASVIAVGIAVNDSDSDSGGTGATSGPVQRVAIELGEFFVRPSSLSVEPGTHLILEVTNNGTMPHDLFVDESRATPMLDPGDSAELDVGVVDAPLSAWCTVPGHAASGMQMEITVVGAESAAPSGAGPAGDAPAAAAPASAIDFSLEAAPEFVPFDPMLEPAPGGTEHEMTIRATEEIVEVAPGVTQEMWLFNGTYPGPVIRGKIGDLFTITLVNDGKMGHSIDFHASEVAWNDEMRTIQPGESLVYQFRSEHAGVWMYHCGTAPALHHIGNGMFGAIIIDPPDLEPVDHEFVLVQSELYLGPDGQPGDLTKMQDQEPDAVVFNGYVNQYRDRPIRVEPHESIRVFVLDAGPNESSSFHIVGTVFDTVFKEGAYQLRPDDTRGGSQALGLQPAQGGFVEFTFEEAGLYVIVTHQFAFVGEGALGLFQAGDIAAGETAAH